MQRGSLQGYVDDCSFRYWDTGGILAVSGIIFKCSQRSTYDRRAWGENIVSLLQVFESVIYCVILLI